MCSAYKLIVVLLIAFEFAHSQRDVGDVCTVTATNSPGVCKLFSDCSKAREDLQKFNRFPQTCGFQGTQPIVCCEATKTAKPTETSKPTEASKPAETPKPTETGKPERQPGVISRRKCREYSTYVYEKKRPPILLINVTEYTRNECGHKVVKLIVKGEIAGRKEFPHMAAIGYGSPSEGIRYLCGGTIISKNFILTAGHCLSDYEQGDAKVVKIGVADLESNSHAQVLEVGELIKYPEYKPSSHYHDIGLIKLKQAAKLDSFARPACLNYKPEINAEKAIATGWGQTSWAGEGSNNLLKVTLDLYDHDFCNASYKNQIGRRLRNGILNDIQVCAGSVDQKDTCQGDSGGPLQIYHIGDEVTCMYDIVGVTSFGKGCSGSPGVYVRVSHYVKWIEDIVWPQ